MDVQYPEMRLVVIEGLGALADLERLAPGSEADEAEFFEIIDDLDHLIGTPDARSGIGVIFVSEAEARAADEFLQALVAVLREGGALPSHAAVVAHQGWPEVSRLAKVALEQLKS
jgi:hypothetical protein